VAAQGLPVSGCAAGGPAHKRRWAPVTCVGKRPPPPHTRTLLARPARGLSCPLPPPPPPPCTSPPTFPPHRYVFFENSFSMALIFFALWRGLQDRWVFHNVPTGASRVCCACCAC
jgi:hypothetical protein